MHLLITAIALQHYPAALVTIEVQADRGLPAHSITISPPSERRPRSAEARDNVVWVATRTWEGGSQSVTSVECSAVRNVAASMTDLPAIPIAPPSRAVSPDPSPIPPTIKDGYSTRLLFRTLNEDGSSSDVTITGGAQYTAWANSAVGALVSCWGPLSL